MRVAKGRVDLDPGDLARFGLVAASFPPPEPVPPGRWLHESPDRLWLELVTQLCVIGGRRPLDAMWQNGEITLLALDRLLTIERRGRDTAYWYAHELLARNGVRYVSTGASTPSVKARQIVDAAVSPLLVRDGTFLLDEILAPHLSQPPDWSEASRQRERAARLALARVVAGFGMKSASDFLKHLGAAQNLIAFDSRIQSVLRDLFGLSEADQRRLVGHTARYEALERPFVEEVCPHIDLSPALLDALLFTNAREARRLFAAGGPRDQ